MFRCIQSIDRSIDRYSNNKSPSSSLSPNDVASMNGINSVLSNNMGLSAFTTMLPNLDDRSKKSQNMTECVPVPSSEHVAEIVGRQGNLIANIFYGNTFFSLFSCVFFFGFCFEILLPSFNNRVRLIIVTIVRMKSSTQYRWQQPQFRIHILIYRLFLCSNFKKLLFDR